jgi:hypothetical protein
MALKVRRISPAILPPASPHVEDEKYLAWIARDRDEFITAYKVAFPNSTRSEDALHQLYQVYKTRWNESYGRAEDPIAEQVAPTIERLRNSAPQPTEPNPEHEHIDKPTRGEMIAAIPVDVRSQEPTMVVIPHRSPVLDAEKELARRVKNRLGFVGVYKTLFPKSRRTYNAINQIWYEHRDKSAEPDEPEPWTEEPTPETEEQPALEVPMEDVTSPIEPRTSTREIPTAPSAPKMVLKRRTIHTIEVWEESD